VTVLVFLITPAVTRVISLQLLLLTFLLPVRNVVDEVLRKNEEAKEKAPDDAVLPVTADVTLPQAREILTRFGQALKLLNAPADCDIYTLVNKAINESETT
jgi:hypothetical protein